jgi:hypothetical protein
MSLINIPGMTEDSLTKLDTAPTGGGLRPFPCDASGWTKQTGCVLKCGIKIFEVNGINKENISIQVGNGQYGAEILISLDVTDVAPGTRDVAKAQQQNLETLTKAIKCLGAHSQGKLDTAKLEKAHGQCVEFICKHKGFSTKGNSTYHKIGYIFTGEVPDIQDVTMVQMPQVPGSSAPAFQPSGDYDPFGN